MVWLKSVDLHVDSDNVLHDLVEPNHLIGQPPSEIGLTFDSNYLHVDILMMLPTDEICCIWEENPSERNIHGHPHGEYRQLFHTPVNNQNYLQRTVVDGTPEQSSCQTIARLLARW